MEAEKCIERKWNTNQAATSLVQRIADLQREIIEMRARRIKGGMLLSKSTSAKSRARVEDERYQYFLTRLGDVPCA